MRKKANKNKITKKKYKKYTCIKIYGQFLIEFEKLKKQLFNYLNKLLKIKKT